MMTQDNGEPAFPTGFTDEHGFAQEGMSLRDYFAAKAMQGLCANSGGPFQSNSRSGWGLVNCTNDQISEAAYLLSDAMLRARQA